LFPKIGNFRIDGGNTGAALVKRHGLFGKIHSRRQLPARVKIVVA
jgi:hypothetical protein